MTTTPTSAREALERIAKEAGRRVLHDKVHTEARNRHLADATQSGYEHHSVVVAAEMGAAIALANLKPEPAAGEVTQKLLDRAERAWQRFFYPANDCFVNDIGDKHVSVDLEVADCLRLTLAQLGRHVVTPDGDVPRASSPSEPVAGEVPSDGK